MKTQLDGNSGPVVIDNANGADADADADIMKLAREADAAPEGADLGAEPTAAKLAKPADEKKTTAKADDKTEAGTKTGKQDAKPSEKGKETKADPKTDTTAKPGEQGESKFVQAQKEADRRDKSWQALEKEKQEFRTEKNAITAELQGLRREVSELRKAKTAGPAKDNHGLTADDYDKIARDYREAGDDRMAKAATERAETLRKQPSTAAEGSRADAEPWKSPEFQTEWQRNTQELISKEPELADPANPLVRAANALLADGTYGRFFKSAPDGIKAAVEVAKLMRDANGAQELKQQLATRDEELKTSKAEIDRLNGLLQPRGSHPAGPAKGKDGELTDDDVKQIAAAADRGELDT